MWTGNSIAVSVAVVAALRVLCTASDACATVTLESLLREMSDAEAIARWPEPEFVCRQASSYDRERVAPDRPGWFANQDQNQFIRTEENAGRHEKVMFDFGGPGAIVRFWLTTVENKQGTLRIYLDNRPDPVFVFSAFDLLTGDLGVREPFVLPHPGYQANGNGGSTLMFPIPYAKHCKVTWEEAGHGPRYYQINTRLYAADTEVQTLTREQIAASKEQIATVGRQLQHPLHGLDGKTRSLDHVLVPGATADLDLPNGSAAVRELELRLETTDPREAERVFRSVIVQLTFDGEVTAWCPSTDFFGSGVGVNDLHSWYRTVAANGAMCCRWVMPYRKRGRVSLINVGARPVQVALRAVTEPWTWDRRSMHFHAAWHSGSGLKTPPPRDWNFIRIEGRGVYAGDSLALFNPVATWYGEGNEKIWVDGESFPSHLGTGTEDYYGYSFAPKPPFQTPFSNLVREDDPMTQGWNVMGRTRNLDGIPFHRSLQFDMELMSWKPTELTYCATTYWYAFSGAASNVKPQPQDASQPIPTLAEVCAQAKKTQFRLPGTIGGEPKQQ